MTILKALYNSIFGKSSEAIWRQFSSENNGIYIDSKYGNFDSVEMGWLIIALSIPYNIFGSVICFFLTKKGSELFKNSA